MNSRGAARLAWAGAVISLAVFVWAGLGCIDYCSATYDEPAHLVAGYSYWKTRDFRLDQDVPPLTKLLAALPCLVLENPPFAPQPKLWDWGDQFGLGVQFLFESKVPADRLLFLARLPMLGMGLALVLLCGWWARRLWGTGAGLTALALAAFDPNLIGHASTVNSDVAAALFSTLALYAIWEYSQTAS
ncbi:MAG: hypothetical protein HY303_05800, partial [Candidatus Wallbacteria bacterium]|nr:hypothetical protein [Candidatus Wallbacteria bacterium]